ncbi:uncharacterized protein EURHEDRAFT_383989 [Aspergillus ruber CBS 135680]|uniref:Uncharacterized protein n=1 Tax=Aspergillus ruber (strain CBS 135680) TaxID=1388766 RepID=A0A017SMJ0_ASPRC|nr:uncharacterized protein EURHEDRAFT_383989 [Aspergillus ruber CBS 135680]EYE97991.1 hypothetical protein EURHEDRAFT_383989 [Aspergillus ruber CBS 135680]
MEDVNLGLLFSRQSSGTCSAGSLAEEATCVQESTCNGAFFPNQCGTGSECCFIRSCNISQGNGLCKNDTRDACDGLWYTGDPFDPPCPGDSSIRCCIAFANLNNGTDTDDSSDSNNSSNGLTGSQIGGIVGGVVGGVIVLAALFLIFLFGYWRKRQRNRQNADIVETVDGDRKENENGRGRFVNEVEAREVAELDGNERRELDGHGQAVYELEGGSVVDGRQR